MTAPESVRDRLERRARHYRDAAEAAQGSDEWSCAVATAAALEEVVAALDGASEWLTANPGANGDREGEDVSPGGSA